MGSIARVLSFTRTTRPNGVKVSDVKSDPGGGLNLTSPHFSGPGDDSHPLEGDLAILTESVRGGGRAVVGYVDPKLEPVAQPGEKRIYARDSSGAAIVEVWLKADGEVTLLNANGSFTLGADGSQLGQNSNGSFELEAGGDVVINGVRITPAGKITGVTELEVDGKELKDHNHNITSGSSAPGPTEANN